MRTMLVTLTLAVAGTAGASPRLAPARFAAGHGWHVGASRVHGCPGIPRSRCEQVESWAATVRWRDCGNCLPHRTLAALPPAGVAIQLLVGRDTKSAPSPPLAWPPRLRPRDVVGPIEGGPKRIGSTQRSGTVHGLTASLFVFFGRRHPTARQLARANAELRTARWP